MLKILIRLLIFFVTILIKLSEIWYRARGRESRYFREFIAYKSVLNVTRMSYLAQSSYVYWVFNPETIQLLNKLVEIRYVDYYEFLENKAFLRIYLLYDIDFNPPYKFTKLLFNEYSRVYISYEKLCKLHKYNFNIVCILFTTQGLLTQSEAINEKVGGELICVLYS